MSYPCALIRLHEDGKVEVDKELIFDYPTPLDLSYNGYVTLILREETFTDIYVVGTTEGTTKAYLEGFLLGRNIDYIKRSSLDSEEGFKFLIQTSFERLVIQE